MQDLLDAMAKNQADFTLTFRRLSDAAFDPDGDAGSGHLFADPTAYDDWAVRWRQRITDEPQAAAERKAAMRSVNPAFIPRNHRVEAVIQAAVNRDDFAPFEELLTVLSKPYQDQPALPVMPIRRSRTSAYCRRFAGPEALTALLKRPCTIRSQRFHKLRNGQRDPDKSIVLIEGFVMDAFAFEFIGLAMVALCLIVLAIPAGRRPSRTSPPLLTDRLTDKP